MALWIATFYPVYPELISTWLNHSNNSHGILVPFISLYFTWQKKAQLQNIKTIPCNWGLFILLVSLLIYLLSFAGSVAVISRLMIVSSLFGLILFSMGKEVCKILTFPLFFLVFMIPVPDSLISTVSLPLQLFASRISTIIIQAFSIPVLREGNMLYFVQTQLEVAEACSGIKSIVSLTMLSVIFVHLSKKGPLRKIILVASAVPIALMANIIRVTGTGILAHFYGSVVARGFLHEFSGLVVFASGFLVLMLEFSVLNKFWKTRE